MRETDFNGFLFESSLLGKKYPTEIEKTQAVSNEITEKIHKVQLQKKCALGTVFALSAAAILTSLTFLLLTDVQRNDDSLILNASNLASGEYTSQLEKHYIDGFPFKEDFKNFYEMTRAFYSLGYYKFENMFGSGDSDSIVILGKDESSHSSESSDKQNSGNFSSSVTDKSSENDKDKVSESKTDSKNSVEIDMDNFGGDSSNFYYPNYSASFESEPEQSENSEPEQTTTVQIGQPEFTVTEPPHEEQPENSQPEEADSSSNENTSENESENDYESSAESSNESE